MVIKTKHSIWDRIESGDIESLKPIKPYHLLVLTGKMRDYIVKQVKDPLRIAFEAGKGLNQVLKTMVSVAELIPAMTKRNVLDKRTHNLMAIEERFFSYNHGREELLKAAWKIYKFEVCHDEFYQGRHDFLIEQIVMMILTGEWVNRSERNPLPKLWEEPQPYGGKNTIIYALQQNREKIIDLLGSKWLWLKEGRYEFNPADNVRGT